MVPLLAFTEYLAVPDPLPEPDTVIQVLFVEALHVQPGCVVTVIIPAEPVRGALISEGVRLNRHVPLASVTVNVLPAIVKVVDLASEPVLAAAS